MDLWHTNHKGNLFYCGGGGGATYGHQHLQQGLPAEGETGSFQGTERAVALLQKVKQTKTCVERCHFGIYLY